MHAGKTRVCRASIDSEGGGNVPRRADEYLKQLAKVPMFRALSKRDLALVKRNAEDHHIRKGEPLVKEGSRGHEFFIIVDGKASVRRKGKKIGTRSEERRVGKEC